MTEKTNLLTAILSNLPDADEEPFSLPPKSIEDLRIDRIIERGDA